MSTAAQTDAWVLSSSGRTTRNLDQASHRQNSTVAAPFTSGPSPKSYCAHMPGSGIHGRNTRRRPECQAFFSRATARRVVRSDPAYPIAVIFSCATSARILPLLRSTSSSSLGRKASITPGRSADAPGTSRPSSLART
jgi:hypothetical protein